MLPQYFIETAAYAIPTPHPIVGGLSLEWSIRNTLQLLGLLPAHLFLTLSKRDEQGNVMSIAALHGLSTRMPLNKNSDLQKSILSIGTEATDKLVLYHIFNNRDYLLKQSELDDETEKQKISEMMEKEKGLLGLTDQEDKENFQAADQITGGYGQLYWIEPNGGRRVAYGDIEGEDYALDLWKILTDFQKSYNQNPSPYPYYGLGIAPFIGKPPLNSNAAFTTFAYLLGAPINSFAPFCTPGLGQILALPSILETWVEQCQSIKIQRSVDFEQASTDTSEAVLTPPGSSILHPSDSLMSFFADNPTAYDNKNWDKVASISSLTPVLSPSTPVLSPSEDAERYQAEGHPERWRGDFATTATTFDVEALSSSSSTSSLSSRNGSRG